MGEDGLTFGLQLRQKLESPEASWWPVVDLSNASTKPSPVFVDLIGRPGGKESHVFKRWILNLIVWAMNRIQIVLCVDLWLPLVGLLLPGMHSSYTLSAKEDWGSWLYSVDVCYSLPGVVSSNYNVVHRWKFPMSSNWWLSETRSRLMHEISPWKEIDILMK